MIHVPVKPVPSLQVLCAVVDPTRSRCSAAAFAGENAPPGDPSDADSNVNVTFRAVILPFLDLALRYNNNFHFL